MQFKTFGIGQSEVMETHPHKYAAIFFTLFNLHNKNTYLVINVVFRISRDCSR